MYYAKTIFKKIYFTNKLFFRKKVFVSPSKKFKSAKNNSFCKQRTHSVKKIIFNLLFQQMNRFR